MSKFSEMVAARLALEKQNSLPTTPVPKATLVEERVERRPFEHRAAVQRKPLTLSERFGMVQRGLSPAQSINSNEKKGQKRTVTVKLIDRSEAPIGSLQAHFYDISESTAARVPIPMPQLQDSFADMGMDNTPTKGGKAYAFKPLDNLDEGKDVGFMSEEESHDLGSVLYISDTDEDGEYF